MLAGVVLRTGVLPVATVGSGDKPPGAVASVFTPRGDSNPGPRTGSLLEDLTEPVFLAP